MYYGLRSEEENVNWLEFAHEFKRKIGEKNIETRQRQCIEVQRVKIQIFLILISYFKTLDILNMYMCRSYVWYCIEQKSSQPRNISR